MSIVNVAFWSATHLPHLAYYKSQSFSWLPPILEGRAFHFDRKWDCPSHLRTSVPPFHVPFCGDVLQESLFSISFTAWIPSNHFHRRRAESRILLPECLWGMLVDK